MPTKADIIAAANAAYPRAGLASDTKEFLHRAAGSSEVFAAQATKMRTPPVLADFPTWVNQGSKTATQIVGGGRGNRNCLRLQGLQPGAGENVGGVFRSLSGAASWTYYLEVTISQVLAINQHCGIATRNSSTGAIYAYGMRNGDFHAIRYTNPTTFSSLGSNVSAGTVIPGISSTTPAPERWLFRLQNNNTNIAFHVSGDSGYTWHLVHSASKTDFTTPDQIGIYINPLSATFMQVLDVHHWELTTP